MQPTILAIIGKPLSGKDTQADLLVAAHPESVNISTGQIIREVRAVGEAHQFWPLISPYLPMMEQGLKLPDEPTLAMLGQVIGEQIAAGKKLLVIAGSPRGMVQLDGFDEITQKNGAKLLFVHVDTTDEETFRRCAARNEERVDDTPSIHQVRLAEYRAYVVPVVEQLRREGKLIELDGMAPVEKVFRQLETQVRRHTMDPEITLPPMARK